MNVFILMSGVAREGVFSTLRLAKRAAEELHGSKLKWEWNHGILWSDRDGHGWYIEKWPVMTTIAQVRET